MLAVRFTLNGDQFEVDASTVIGRLLGREPEPVQVHWVEVGGVRFPVKQALEAVLGVSRTTFTSHMARSQFARLGFLTSNAPDQRHGRAEPRPPASGSAVSIEEAGEAFATLVAFLRHAPFTASIDRLERDLVDTDISSAPVVTGAAGLSEELLEAALVVRRDVGRVSDVIHATVIALVLPKILEPGEVISNRPSLGPGNDKTRPYDLETNRRVAEFKVALWSSGDMMRKRTLTADLVHLALDQSGRRPELWVAGTEPTRFLRTSTILVGDLLSRASHHLRTRYHDRYGTDGIPVREFLTRHAAHVHHRNIADVLPTVSTALG
ncbi:hypothetical protein [Lentzea terrae]|uniref:hypothetical protein n=1 Tax=Lentzea terrae TaxID=2200761 RepID=UPI001300ABEE|nr:hypothetical protein [Lentzea terrae]